MIPLRRSSRIAATRVARGLKPDDFAKLERATIGRRRASLRTREAILELDDVSGPVHEVEHPQFRYTRTTYSMEVLRDIPESSPQERAGDMYGYIERLLSDSRSYTTHSGHGKRTFRTDFTDERLLYIFNMSNAMQTLINKHVRRHKLRPADRLQVQIEIAGSDTTEHISSPLRPYADSRVSPDQTTWKENHTLLMSKLLKFLYVYYGRTESKLNISLAHYRMAGGGTHKRVSDIGSLFTKKCVTRMLNIGDEFCGALALVYARYVINDDAKACRTFKRHMANYEKYHAEFRRSALDLYEEACVEPGYVLVDEHTIKKFERVLKRRIIIHSFEQLSVHNKPYVFTPADKYVDDVHLILANDHYHYVSSPAALLSCKQFCRLCCRGFQHNKHVCRFDPSCKHCAHKKCDHADAAGEGLQLRCDTCNFTFKTQKCFDNHRIPVGKARGAASLCSKVHNCKHCNMSYKTSKQSKKHICFKIQCSICKGEYDYRSKHTCYLQKVKTFQEKLADRANQRLKKGEERKTADDVEVPTKRLIFADIECCLEPLSEMHYKHIPGCVVACVVDFTVGETPALDNIKTFQRTDPSSAPSAALSDFCKWLISPENSHATVFFHNLKGYDAHPILEYCQLNSIEVELTGRTKVMTFTIPSIHMRFIDSLNYLSYPLR